MSDDKIIEKLYDDIHYYILENEDYDKSIDYLLGLSIIKPRINDKDKLDEEKIQEIKKDIYRYYDKYYKDPKKVLRYLFPIDPQYIYIYN